MPQAAFWRARPVRVGPAEQLGARGADDDPDPPLGGRCVAAASVALLAGAVALSYADRHLVPDSGWDFSSVFEQVTFMAVPAVGFVLASRRPGNRIGWIFLGAGLVLIVPGSAGVQSCDRWFPSRAPLRYARRKASTARTRRLSSGVSVSPSLSKIRRTLPSTVFSLRKRRWPMALFVPSLGHEAQHVALTRGERAERSCQSGAADQAGHDTRVHHAFARHPRSTASMSTATWDTRSLSR